MRAMEPAEQTLEGRAPQQPHDREGRRGSDQIAREIEEKNVLPCGKQDIGGAEIRSAQCGFHSRMSEHFAGARSALRLTLQIRLADFGNGQRACADFARDHTLCPAEGAVEGAERVAPIA